jgi:hypothetical protein
MGLKEVFERLGSERSVKAAFVLEGEFYIDVLTEEGGIVESSGMPFVNRALEEVRKRTAAVCMFCDGALERPVDHIMVMEDSRGNVVGHDVPACKMDDFKDNPDIVWLCDDFAMFPYKAVTHEIMMVMLPQKTRTVGESEGVKDAIILYPATTTDLMLREHFGIPGDAKLASAIIAFNIL